MQKGTVATAVASNSGDTYANRLAAALERAGVSRRGLARMLADREGGSVETKRRNVYKWLDEGVEPEPLRAGLLAILLNAPELAVLSPRRAPGNRLEHRLEELATLAVENEAILQELRLAIEEHDNLLQDAARALGELGGSVAARLDQLESRVRALEK